MNPITIPNISIPTIGIPTIGIPSVGFPSASGGGGLSWPAGMKEHIKAWYDPKKQGMTNYDVIEAYVEDFTNWYKEINNGTVTATNKSFHFTEVKKIGFTNAIVRLVSHRINGEIKLNIKGVTEDNPISFTEYSTPVLTVNKDGVYTLVINDATVGIYFTKVGVVDVTVTQLPTSILKDFSGNGNHAYLYGGKGKLNSGMGVYNEDFTTYTVRFDNNKPYEQYYNKVIIHNSDDYVSNFWKNVNKPPLGQKEYSGFKLKISGLPKNSKVNIRVYYGDDYSQIKTIEAITDEIVVIPKTTANVITANKTFTYIDFNLTRYKNTITIEQIPDYPDQLCYDGKMYAVAYDMPILTDYTVMAERTWFESGPYCAFISNRDDDIPENRRGAFVFEQLNGGVQGTSSFGSIPSINFVSEKISWQTKESYNGKSIGFGSNISSNPVIVVGAGVYYTNSDRVASYANLCHGAIIVADRSFTEEEINWLKQNWDKI